MICATLNAQGALVPMQPQPDIMTGCAYVIQSGAEITANPFLMTPTEATQLGGAIALLWVTVAVITSVVRRS